MQKKLKSIFRRSIGKTPEPFQGAHASNGYTKPNLSNVGDQSKSAHNRDYSAATVANGGPQSGDAGRPASPPRGPFAVQPSAVGSVSEHGKISGNRYSTLGSGKQPTHGRGGGTSPETANGSVATRNLSNDRNKKQPLRTDETKSQQLVAVPTSTEQNSFDRFAQAPYTDDDSFASARGSVSSSNYGETSNLATNSIQPEPSCGIIERNLKPPVGDQKAPQLPLEEAGMEGGPVKFQSATKDGHEESEFHKQLRMDGVVDLTDTVDTDGDITWAPGVTHEVIKPHQHEIVQTKIFREIHNYEYFHRIQPVMMTEVLPPRHWIPNPEGEGLIEISADELPARTGENRWWSVIQHESPYSAQKTQIKWRTEPEMIERGMTITKEGFERRETIILHPPTLASLEDYRGPVQPVHFDHKTGKRWLGEMSTMEELQDLQKLLDSAPEAHAFQLTELNESLPKMSPKTMPKRKSLPIETRA